MHNFTPFSVLEAMPFAVKIFEGFRSFFPCFFAPFQTLEKGSVQYFVPVFAFALVGFSCIICIVRKPVFRHEAWGRVECPILRQDGFRRLTFPSGCQRPVRAPCSTDILGLNIWRGHRSRRWRFRSMRLPMNGSGGIGRVCHSGCAVRGIGVCVIL